jgi:hypothetical protein
MYHRLPTSDAQTRQTTSHERHPLGQSVLGLLLVLWVGLKPSDPVRAGFASHVLIKLDSNGFSQTEALNRVSTGVLCCL